MFIVSLLLLVSCQATALSGPHSEFIGYRAQKSMLTEVYETTRNWVTVGGPEILGPRRFYNEFAGSIQSCSDAEFHCFLSGLRVAVPREDARGAWTAGGHECRVLDAPELLPDRTVRILCRTNEEQSVEFSYSRQRGILSYRRQCPGCFAGEYVLVTETGLFASPRER